MFRVRSCRSSAVSAIAILALVVLPQIGMLELNREQRRVFVEKVPDAANVAAGALLFGQFLSDRPFSFAAALVGVGVWVLLVMWAVVLARKGGS